MLCAWWSRAEEPNNYILPRHWLYLRFSQFHSSGTYSVLSWSTSVLASKSFLCCVAFDFYCATLCISAVFAVARCPSVCQVGVLYPHGWRYFRLPSQPRSPISLSFWPPVPIPNSKGTPSVRSQNTRGWEKFIIFDWNCRLSRKWYEKS